MGLLLCTGIGVLFLAGLLWFHRQKRRLFPEDPPSRGARHQHQGPVAMLGVIPGVGAGGILLACLPHKSVGLAVLLCAVCGYLDDRGKVQGAGLHWLHKALGLGLALALPCFELSGSLGDGLWMFLWLFAMTNAVNFMDNSNGVCAALGGCGLLLAAGVSGPWAWCAGLFLACLPFNWPRAHIFLGDAGALALGAALALASLAATEHRLGWALLLPGLVFALDFVQVISARLILGVPPWQGDRRHLTHIMMNLGLPQGLVAPCCVGLGLLGFYALTP